MLRRRFGLFLLALFLSVLSFKWWIDYESFQDVTHRSHTLAGDVVSIAKETILAAVRSHLAGDMQARPRNVDTLQRGVQRLQTLLDDFLDMEAAHTRVKDPVSQALKAEYRLPPNGSPLTTRPSQPENNPSGLCDLLAGKRISMIGGSHVYLLHKYLLRDRERTEKKTFPCMHREFCTHHHICLTPSATTSLSPSQPEETSRYVQSPTTQQLVETESALVNYILSDTLFASPDESSWQYSVPFFEHTSAVRSHETFWLAGARKDGVLILGRGPLRAPGNTYSGNWSFLEGIPNHLGEIGTTRAWGAQHEASTSAVKPRPLEIANAAICFTLTYFFPDILQVLKTIREEVHPGKRRTLLWTGCWYRLPLRGLARSTPFRSVLHLKDRLREFWQGQPAQYREQVDIIAQLGMLLDSETMGLHEDPWTFYYNMQVFLHNLLLRELLPPHGIIFMPLNIPWSEYILHHKTSMEPCLPLYDARCISNFESAREEAIGALFLTELRDILRFWIDL